MAFYQIYPHEELDLSGYGNEIYESICDAKSDDVEAVMNIGVHAYNNNLDVFGVREDDTSDIYYLFMAKHSSEVIDKIENSLSNNNDD